MRLITLCIIVFALAFPVVLKSNDQSDQKPIKVFILAGDENVLEQGIVNGHTNGIHDDFFPNPARTKGEQKKHVNAAVYEGAYSPQKDYDKLKPVAKALVELGQQRTRRANPKKKGRVPVPMTSFPKQAFQDGFTTVLRGYVSVKFPGKYEFLPGDKESSFNVTTVEGKEVYRRETGQEQATINPINLKPKKRYAFKTIFFGKPGHEFRIPLINKPGTLNTAIAENSKYAFLKDDKGNWVTRDDVVLYDVHSIHNNTEAPAKPLQVGVDVRRGANVNKKMGVDLMLGHRLGNAFEEPVMLLRFATRHPTWFKYGSRDLAHDYRPPSSGGGSDLDGSWDVIHFNFGVWDATYRDSKSKYFSGYNTTSVEDFEKNLRTLVGKMKKTGATLIWASVTPVWKGEAGKLNGDEDAYNKVAEKVMKENGVIIDDLNAEVRRQGAGKSKNVHDVGNLAPKVTETILKALKERDKSTKPLPRVLFIGDSITGTYWKKVKSNLDGKAAVFKNPGNAEDTWNGLERMDQWLNLKRYLLNGQEYLELVDGVKSVLGKELERAYPGYAGQGTELAGFIWLQGTADAASSAKAKSYEKNLANLIRDLRKDLKAPKLPVVVAALANAKGKLSPNQQKIFDAQMAVGDPKKYPDFADNVISIDTRPMCRPPKDSPGSRDPYAGNAESYLEIGDAMGRAMLKMVKEK